ncbi:MAG: hypothetical protein Tsb008_05870 [Rhodothalassiaceae bacterium]
MSRAPGSGAGSDVQDRLFMRKALHLAIVSFGLTAAFPAAAADAPRFKSSGFLESLGLFSDQKANLAPDGTLPSGLKVDFAFRGEPAAHEPGFLYFQEDGADARVRPVPVSPSPIRFTPRFSALGGQGPTGVGVGGVGESFTPRAGSAEVRLSLSAKAPEEGRALSFTLHSEFLNSGSSLLEGAALFDDPDAASPLDLRARSFGVTLAWLGFRLGAALNHQDSGLLGGQDGFDLGIGYQGGGFTTALSFGEFSEANLDALSGIRAGSYTRLELGAAYAISERLRVSGGIRLFDYSRRFDIAGNSGDRSGLLYLGTRFNF